MVLAAIAASGVVITGATNIFLTYLFFVRNQTGSKEFKCPECGTSVNEAETLCPSCHVSFVRDEAVCPVCGDVVPAKAEVCRSCGTLFHDEEVYVCPGCKKKVLPESTSCENCGAEFWSPLHPASKKVQAPPASMETSSEDSVPSEPAAT